MIYPAALAVAQDIGANGQDFLTSCVVGYEVGCRAGEYLGKSHYEVEYDSRNHTSSWILTAPRNSTRRLPVVFSVLPLPPATF